MDHHADPAKSRGQYLPLLELSVAEAPEDDRNTHYLAGSTCSTAGGTTVSARWSAPVPAHRRLGG